jgi:ribosomal protein L16 Arg81 hydroxylase
MTTLLGPGDFLYMPPCWWHLISIPDEFTISFTTRWRPMNELRRLWSYWRWRIGDKFFGTDSG